MVSYVYDTLTRICGTYCFECSLSCTASLQRPGSFPFRETLSENSDVALLKLSCSRRWLSARTDAAGACWQWCQCAVGCLIHLCDMLTVGWPVRARVVQVAPGPRQQPESHSQDGLWPEAVRRGPRSSWSLSRQRLATCLPLQLVVILRDGQAVKWPSGNDTESESR